MDKRLKLIKERFISPIDPREYYYNHIENTYRFIGRYETNIRSIFVERIDVIREQLIEAREVAKCAHNDLVEIKNELRRVSADYNDDKTPAKYQKLQMTQKPYQLSKEQWKAAATDVNILKAKLKIAEVQLNVVDEILSDEQKAKKLRKAWKTKQTGYLTSKDYEKVFSKICSKVKEAHIDKDKRVFLEFISPDEKVSARILELEGNQFAFYYDLGQEADFMFNAKICPSLIKAINEMLISLTETKGFSMKELNSFDINIRRCK